jgi:thioredoxin reductase/ferredoxin
VNPLRRYARWLHGRWPAGGVEALPVTHEDGRTNVPGLRVVGDLRGVPLLKLSADSGARAVRGIAAELGRERGDATAGARGAAGDGDVRDLVIIGAGVSGLAAALEARKLELDFVVLEAAVPLATIVNFPRGKPIYAYPKDMTPAGELRITADVKEDLVAELERQTLGAGLEVRTAHAESVRREGGVLHVRLEDGGVLRARHVIAALGRSGNFRRLGVPGEERDNVLNRLHDPSDYRGRRVLVVGGGGSAVEAAIALRAAGADVTLSYRGRAFVRPKPENVERLEATPGLRVRLGSRVRRIGAESVELESADGSAETIPNDVVFPMIGREVPLDFFRRSGVAIAGERSGRFWVTLAAFVAAIAFVDHWKAGGHLTALFEAHHLFPFDLPVPADASTLAGTLGVSFRTPAAWYSLAYTAVVTLFGIRRIRRRRTPYITLQTVTLTLLQAIPLFLLPFVLLPWAGNAGAFGDRYRVERLSPETVSGWWALEKREAADGTPDPRMLAAAAARAGLLPAAVRDWPDLAADVSWKQRVDGDRVILHPAPPASGGSGAPVREAVLRLSDARMHVRDDTRPGSRVADALFPASEWDPQGREYWRAIGLILAWPLFLWNVFTYAPMGTWLVISLLQTFVAIPLLVYFFGKGAYCGWICSCGALAETMGDAHRHKMPHGPAWNRLNLVGQWILLLAFVLLLLRVAAWLLPWGHPLHALYSALLQGKTPSGASLPFPLPFLSYGWLVDLFLAGIVGTGLYFHFSGRVWCRFACPLAALMHVYARFSRFRILADKKKCISCNVCTSVCHQGIDVMSFANKGLPMADPECVRCSACVQSCPTGVLTFAQVDARSGRVIAVDRLPASAVQMREGTSGER